MTLPDPITPAPRATVEDALTPRGSAGRGGREAAAVFAAAVALYLALLSRQYIGDGLRWLLVYDEPVVPRPGTHAWVLFPYVGWAMRRAAGAVGVERLPIWAWQACSAVMAAIGLALLHRLLAAMGIDRLARTLGVAFAGLSHAYLLHATDMTEPALSIPPILLGLVLVRERPASLRARIVGGALIGLGATLYEAALGALLPACVMIGAASFERDHASAMVGVWASVRRGVLRAAPTGIAALLVLVAALVIAPRLYYGAAGNPATDALQFGGGIFGSFSPRRLGSVPFGFANALAPLHQWRGASRLLRAPAPVVAYNGAVLLLAGALAFLLVTAHRRGWRSCSWRRRGDVAGAAGWMVGIACFAAFWEPMYEKLWLNGCLATAILLACALSPEASLRLTAAASSAGWRGRPIAGLAAALALTSLATGGLPRRLRPNWSLAAANQLTRLVGPRDLFVSPGWDAVTVNAFTIHRIAGSHFNLMQEALSNDRSVDVVARNLRDSVTAALDRGGRVLFLGMIDVSEEEWAEFYGSRLAMPYALLQPFRGRAVPVARFEHASDDGSAAVQLLEYRPDSAGPAAPPTPPTAGSRSESQR